MESLNRWKRRRVEPHACTSQNIKLTYRPPTDNDFAFELQMREAVTASSSSTQNNDRFFLCFKGLEVEDNKSKAKLGAIAVGIFDSEDDLVYEVSKPLVLPEAEMTDEVAELEAIVEGLEFALSLKIGNVMFPYTDSLYPYLYGNQKDKGAKVAELADRAVLLRKTFRNFHPYVATEKNVQLVLEFARSSIAKQARSLIKEECLICLDDVDSEKMFEIGGCRHRFCSSCMQKHVKLKVEDRELPQCPQPNCGLELNINACRKLLASKMHDILDELVKESSIPAKEKVYCPNPKCSKLMSRTEVLENNMSLGWTSSTELTACRCLKCHTLFCISCKVLWHSNMSCDAYKKAELADEKLDKLAKKKKWKQCPKCSHMVERNRGCNHIYCRCGAHFCYKCGCEYKNYFSCSCVPKPVLPRRHSNVNRPGQTGAPAQPGPYYPPGWKWTMLLPRSGQ